jgi:hypothetical protein
MRRLVEVDDDGFVVAVRGILAGLFAAPAANEKEAMVRAVTVWDKNCSGNTRSSWDDMAAAWYNEITNGAAAPAGHGGERWNKTAFYSNTWTSFYQGGWHVEYVVDSDFTDPSLVPWGKDHTDRRLDDVDAAMIALHGGPQKRRLGRIHEVRPVGHRRLQGRAGPHGLRRCRPRVPAPLIVHEHARHAVAPRMVELIPRRPSDRRLPRSHVHLQRHGVVGPLQGLRQRTPAGSAGRLPPGPPTDPDVRD